MFNCGGFILARFRGQYNNTVDAKGRLNIPAKFRKALAPEANEIFAICQAPGHCLRAYPQDAWNRYEDELASRPQTPEALRHLRLLRSTLTDSKLDTQGRIMLGKTQMEVAGITKNVTLIGYYGYIEIWDAEKYNQYIGSGDDFDNVFFESVEVGIRAKL